MNSSYTFEGIVTDSQTLHLNEPLPVSAGAVRVTVEIVNADKPPWELFLEAIWADRAASGRPRMPVEEIDAWVADIIDSRGD